MVHYGKIMLLLLVLCTVCVARWAWFDQGRRQEMAREAFSSDAEKIKKKYKCTACECCITSTCHGGRCYL
jgi:cbb3-type cytochrome oxidase subunit 3